MNGYAGSILRIDLSRDHVERQPLPPQLAREFIGGRGFVAKLLFDELQPGTDPLSEQNMLIIATGPLSGHFMPASGKTHFGTKSPATGGYADSNMGGHFGPALKYAGYDALVLTGRAAAPSLLVIDDDKVERRDGAPYWGLGAIETETQLKADLGEDFQIITVGPAAENGVRFACISHDFGRQAGRTGVGLVLANKNIKAVAVRGSGQLPVHDLPRAFEAGKDAYRRISEKPGFKGWTPEGTAGITNWINEVGAFPTRNFASSFAGHYQQINGKAVIERLKITDKGCFCCPTPCGKYGHAKTVLGTAHVEGPEFETIALFGGNCLLQTIEEIAYANYLCDQWGIDTISAGAVISWTIECFEKGLLSRARIGRELSFGHIETVAYLLERIALRRGIGDLLADGVKAAARQVGRGSEAFAIHVKGLEWSGYETRNAPSMMLAYLTSDIGAHHGRAWVLGHDVAGSWSSVHDLIASGGEVKPLPKAVIGRQCADYVIESQHLRPTFDMLGVCRLQLMELGFEVNHYEHLFQVITGQSHTWDELLKISEKVWHLTRAFSAREIDGFGRAWDYPPARFSHEPIPDGPNAGHFIGPQKIDRLLDWYYAARGWDRNGIPTRETLTAAGLPAAAEALQAKGCYS